MTTYSISTVNLNSRLGTSPNDSASTVPAGEKGTDGTISADMEVERAENSFDMEKDQNAEVLEHWMVLEYCDRGNLDSAISAGRFLDKVTGAPDLVRPTASDALPASGFGGHSSSKQCQLL